MEGIVEADGAGDADAAARAARRRRRAAAAAAQAALAPGALDPATRFLYTPHSVTCLLAGLAAIAVVARPFDPPRRPADPAAADAAAAAGARAGAGAAAAVFLLYSAVQGPGTAMVRPHPAVWRAVHGALVLYLLGLVFLLFQSVDDARALLRHLFPELGVRLPERRYGDDCALWLPAPAAAAAAGGARGAGAVLGAGGAGAVLGAARAARAAAARQLARVNWRALRATVWDEFTLAHALGWFVKALILRDVAMLWAVSVAFELAELSLRHLLPNFVECWWDSWLLDVALCNAGGIAAGMWAVRRFRSRRYDWRGLSAQPSLLAKAARGLQQFTPYAFDGYAWRAFSSPRRCAQCLLPPAAILLFEVNAFFLKAELWVPPRCPLNAARLALLAAAGLPAAREYYEFIEASEEEDGPSPRAPGAPRAFNKLGAFAWLLAAVALVEAAAVVKFGAGEFGAPWPRAVLVAWGAAGGVAAAVFAAWSWRFYRGGGARPAAARGRARRKSE